MRISTKAISILSIMTSLFSAKSFASEPKTCVVSLIGSEKIDYIINERAQKLLIQMGYDSPHSQYYFSSNLKDLKACFENESIEEVILVAHALQGIAGHTSMVYFTETEEKKQKHVLDARFFKDLKFGKSLRQFTLFSCRPEKVLDEYRNLKRQLTEQGIHVRFPPTHHTASVMTMGQIEGARAGLLAADLIAESAQDVDSQQIFCLIETQVKGFVEKGSSTCVRGHYQVNYRAPVRVGGKTSTRFLKIVPPPAGHEGKWIQKSNHPELEIGFLKGVKIGSRNDPNKVSQDSFGLSIGVGKKIEIKRVPKQL